MNNFAEWFPVQAANLRNCRELSDDLKATFSERFSVNRPLGRDETEREARAFFREHKLLGSLADFARRPSRLGRLQEWTKIEKAFLDIGLLGDKVEPYRSRIVTGDMTAIDELLELLETESLEPVVWCFLGHTDDGPFSGVDVEALPCALGLEKVDARDYMAFELAVRDEISLRKATAFDAAMSPFWCPGTTTCPREECPEQVGFAEVVAPGRRKDPVGLTYKDARRPEFD